MATTPTVIRIDGVLTQKIADAIRVQVQEMLADAWDEGLLASSHDSNPYRTEEDD